MSELAVPFWILTPSVDVSGKMPSVFKELCRPINSNLAQIMSQLPIISEPKPADADAQDDKDEGEKEAETYENVLEYLTR